MSDQTQSDSTCTLCGAPADKKDNRFQCREHPGHMADLITGIFSDCGRDGSSDPVEGDTVTVLAGEHFVYTGEVMRGVDPLLKTFWMRVIKVNGITKEPGTYPNDIPFALTQIIPTTCPPSP